MVQKTQALLLVQGGGVADPFCTRRFSEIDGAACVMAGEGGAMRSAGWNDPYNRERGKQKLFCEYLWQKNHVFRFFWEAIFGRRWPRQQRVFIYSVCFHIDSGLYFLNILAYSLNGFNIANAPCLRMPVTSYIKHHN